MTKATKVTKPAPYADADCFNGCYVLSDPGTITITIGGLSDFEVTSMVRDECYASHRRMQYANQRMAELGADIQSMLAEHDERTIDNNGGKDNENVSPYSTKLERAISLAEKQELQAATAEEFHTDWLGVHKAVTGKDWQPQAADSRKKGDINDRLKALGIKAA